MHTATKVLHNHIIDTLRSSSLPLSAEDITQRLRDDRQLIYSYRQISRHINELRELNQVVMVGKRGRTHLFSLPKQQLEPWQSTSESVDPNHPTIKVMGYNYTPETLAKQLIQTNQSLFNEPANRELRSQLTLLVLGNAAYNTLKAHSILPVAHLYRPLEETNAKLKFISQMIETVLNNELIKTGASGNSISDQTRDQLLEELEPWLMALSTNIRSNIET